MSWFAILVALWAPPDGAPDPGAKCTYKTYSWDVKLKKGVAHETVVKTRAELAADEKDPGVPECTVCQEDQVDVAVEGLPLVTVCRLFAEPVKQALEETRAAGFQVKSLIGYRVGRTRGAIKDGRRTQFSNHSYGTAIDINAESNGLYGDCNLKDVPKKSADLKGCKLRIGGRWDPDKQPKVTVIEGGAAWNAFTKFWKWGGTRSDPTRDFMHFSPDGE